VIRLRIAYFADIRFPLERANGIQTMETCYALAERGHDVDLVVRRDTHEPPRDPFDYYGLPPLDRLRIERAPVPDRPPAARRLAYLAFAAGRAFGRARADVILTRDLAVAALLLRVPSRPPIVYESHGYAPAVAAALPDLVVTATRASPRKLRRLAGREAAVWRRADGYVTITSALAHALTARFGERPRLRVVPDGVRGTNYFPRSGAARVVQNAPTEWTSTIAYAGHLYPWKGVDVLVKALAHLRGVDGLIVGGHEAEPDLARLRALAARLGIADRVTFTGIVPPPEVPNLLRGASVLVLPNTASAISTQFTSPLKLFEYMAAGRPIVASDLPSIREVLTHEANALLVAPGDAHALAAAIQRLLDDQALAGRLAAAALQAAGEYTWRRRAERLEALFEEVSRGQRA
jgi:glycosyltransferase involved in cell wall biosynthesis